MAAQLGKKNKNGLVWAAVLAAIPLAGLVWTIVTYFIDHRPAVIPEERFVLLRDDDLVDFVSTEKQKALLKDLPFARTFVFNGTCSPELSQYFAPKSLLQQGRVVKSAVFLALTNVGREEAETVRFKATPSIPEYHNLGPAETLLICVRVDRVDRQPDEVKISSLELFSARGLGQPLKVSEIPTPEEMATVPGHPGVFLGSPLKRTVQEENR